jgi:hypothetical protein
MHVALLFTPAFADDHHQPTIIHAIDAAWLWALGIIRPDCPPTPEIISAISNWFNALIGDPTQAPRCAFCHAEFWLFHTSPPGAFLLCDLGHTEIPPLAGICPSCAKRPDADLRRAALDLIEARELPIEHFHEGGRT